VDQRFVALTEQTLSVATQVASLAKGLRSTLDDHERRLTHVEQRH
jgi:predicted component of type VI protein secretion system